MGRSYLSKKLKDVSSSGWIFVHAGVGDLVYKKKSWERRRRWRRRVHRRERRSSTNFLCEGSEECRRCWPFCPGSNGHFIDPSSAIWRFSLLLSRVFFFIIIIPSPLLPFIRSTPLLLAFRMVDERE